jgi:hypothetical protein
VRQSGKIQLAPGAPASWQIHELTRLHWHSAHVPVPDGCHATV